MKIHSPRLVQGTARSGILAFTLPEVLVSAVVFALMISGVLSVHIFGLKLNDLVRAKMGASDEARSAISKMVGEIRSAGTIKIGTGNKTSFAEIANGAPQKGNAIQIYPLKTNTANYIRYYWDSTDKRLKRSVNGGTAVTVVANAITNSVVFTSEDYTGTIISDNINNRVIGLSLQFYQLEYPKVTIGPGSLYDFYQLRTKITRRALE